MMVLAVFQRRSMRSTFCWQMIPSLYSCEKACGGAGVGGCQNGLARGSINNLVVGGTLSDHWGPARPG